MFNEASLDLAPKKTPFYFVVVAAAVAAVVELVWH